MLKEYILQNWILILISAAFAISLKTTVFMEKKTIKRMFTLIISIFLLSIIVFGEFYLAELGSHQQLRIIFMAIRYSATPFIIAQVVYTLVEKSRWFIFIPALILAVINVISIFTGIVFGLGEDNSLQRGTLGYLPFIAVGLYIFFLIYILLKRSNKRKMEVVPIAFLGFAFVSGLILPFIFGSDYSKIFCTNIVTALYIYYDFTILMLTKKDPLTGLFNRQSYYAYINSRHYKISAIISIDMNGLKAINDNLGHTAGDEALIALADCFTRSLKRRQECYRIGGDEYIIVCKKNSQKDVEQLIERINNRVEKTEYSCSIGYGYNTDGSKTVDEMIKESDEMMYANKALYYNKKGTGRDGQKLN